MPEEIKIIPREEKMAFWQSNVLILGSLALLLILVFIFTFLRMESRILQDKILEAEKQNILVFSGDIAETRNAIRAISQKIDGFSDLFLQRKDWLKIFDFLRAICHKQTQFKEISFTDKDNILAVSANTRNFKTLAEQILIFKHNGFLERFEVFDINVRDEGSVDFRVKFVLKEVFFSK